MGTDKNASSEPPNSTEPAEILDTVAGALTLDALKLRMAALVAPRRWRTAIQKTSQAIDDGKSLEESFRDNRNAMPAECVALFQEALRTPDPAGLLVQALVTRKEVRESWREFIALIMYPGCLFVFAISVAISFSYLMQSMVTLEWIEEFGLAGLDYVENGIRDQHHAMVGLGMITGWIAIVMLSIFWVGPAWAPLAVVGGIILIGRPLRWINLRELLKRFQLFIDQGLNTGDAAKAVSRSFASGGQAVVAKAVSQRIESGVPLGKSIGESMLSDGLCRPTLLMLDLRQDQLPKALGDTADLIGQLTEQRCHTLATILPVFGLFLVGTLIWASISAYIQTLLPLISMITSLA